MYSLFARIGVLQVAGALVFVARAKIGALVLGPDGIGLVSVIDQFVLLMLQLFAFAIPFSAVKILSKAHSENIDSFKTAYAGLLRLLLILGSLGAVIGMLVFALRPTWLSAAVADHTVLVAIGLLALPAMTLHAFFRNVPAAAMQPITSAVWDVITATIMTAAVVIGILLANVLGYFVGELVGAVTVSTIYYLYLARRFDLSILGTSSSIRLLLKRNPLFVELSAAFYIGSFVTPLTFLVMRLTVLDDLGAASAGILQAAIGISLALNLVLNPLNGLLLTPLVNRAIVASKKAQETRQFQKKLLLPIAVVALPPVLFPDLTVLTLYSSQFMKAADSLYWFIMGQAMMQVGGVATALMIGHDRLKAYATVVVTGTALNALLTVVLVPRFGLLGAGVAMFSGASALAFGSFGYLRARGGFRIGGIAGFGTLVLFVGLGLAGALIGTQPSLDIKTLLMKFFVGVAFLALIAGFSLDPKERRMLVARLRIVFGQA